MQIIHLKILLLISLLVFIDVEANEDKIIVGAIEEVLVGEQNLPFLARVDTGATTSSIHAENIEVDSPGDPQGKLIFFDIINKNGRSIRINSQLDSIVTIRTAEGSEQRYKVWLKIVWKNKVKNTLVTLNDRSQMNYNLILGRSWLEGDFIVDVEKNNTH